MNNVPTPKMVIVEHIAETLWRSYGAGSLKWEDVHPYVRKEHRKDANVALEAALPIICETMLQICEDLTEDSTVLTRIINQLIEEMTQNGSNIKRSTFFLTGKRSGKTKITEKVTASLIAQGEHIHIINNEEITCPTNQCQPQNEG